MNQLTVTRLPSIASAAIRAPQDLPITTAFGLERVLGGLAANIDIFIRSLHPTKHIKIKIIIYIYI